MLTLHVLQGPDRGKRFELPAGEPQLIGRSSEALPITDTTVSRRHAELTPDDGRWFLRDLESSNGTFLNGTALSERVELQPGDQFRCGSTLFVFGTTLDDERENPVRVLPSGIFESTVESTASNDDSMILAAPDPMKAANDHLRVLYELTRLTGSSLERDELLRGVMDLVFDEFKPDRGFILLISRSGEAPEPAVVRYRERPRNRDEGRIPVSRTIIEHTVTRREGVLSTNAMNDQRFQAGDSVRDYGIRSAICVPITAGERTFGVINIDSQMPNFTFTESQLKLLTAMGQHTGLVLLSVEQVEARMQHERLATMGETVASLSHSIRNILQGLRSGADAVELAINRDDIDMAKEGWPILTRNLDRIYGLTLNMLAYSRQRSLDVELTPLNPLLEEVTSLVQQKADRRRVGLILDLVDDMPPIPLDTNAMHQVFTNLLANAIEAAPSKRGVVTISARFDAATSRANITVTDNGPGIPLELRDRIFEAFVSTKGQRGTGLGLAVSRKLVEEHGGSLTVASAPNEGASFRIELACDADNLRSGETKLPKAQPRRDDDRFD